MIDNTTTTVLDDTKVKDADITVNKNVSKEKRNSVKKNVREKLEDSEEIKVVSLVPNVSYTDRKTGDMYEWEEIGHSEYLTVEILKNMWRNHKGYFKNLLLKPLDDRVVNQFGLKANYENYEFLMDESSYTKKNVDSICKSILEAPNSLKYSIYNKIKCMVADGLVSDISVIRALEKRLNMDLISFI